MPPHTPPAPATAKASSAHPAPPAAAEAAAPLTPAPVGTPLRWRSEDLMQQQAQVEIAHGGQIYRLRVTAQGKLILTK